MNGDRLTSLSTDDLQYFEARFFLVPGLGSVYVNATLSVIRQRAVGNGFHEELSILNHDAAPVDLTVRIDADCDFADLFEVKDALRKKGSYSKRVDGNSLLLTYRRYTYQRSTTITSSQPCAIDENGLAFTITVGPHASWTTELDVAIEMLGQETDGAGQSTRGAGEAADHKHGAELGPVARRSARARVRLGDPRGDVPPQPHRPRRAPLLAADRRPRQPPRRGSAVVHDDVRTRQHLHQPAGAARSRRSSPRRRSASSGYARAPASTTSATRIPAGSCTRCASAR